MRETIDYASPRRKSEKKIDKKIYKEPKLESAGEIEKQSAKRKQLSKLNWNKRRLISMFQ